jgi:hypothetical protein
MIIISVLYLIERKRRKRVVRSGKRGYIIYLGEERE